nr:DUF3644 domain-containing protein [Arthrobacter koreensis]
MSMGWLKLLQAHAEINGGDPYIRNSRGHRIRHEDGGWRFKPLHTLMNEYFQNTDPRKANINFFVGLRNIIEHRYERNTAALVAGRTQAYLLNYERSLVDWFGQSEALGSELRFPLFLSSITEDAAQAVKTIRAQAPKGVLEWVQDFDAELEPQIAADQRFDFRIYLIPHKGPKTEADAVMTFVKPEELSPEQRAVMDQVQTIIREKHVPVADLGALRAGQVVEKVAAALGRPFTIHHHTQAWKYFRVRPPTNSTNKQNTKADFCRYNAAFEQYVYTEAWVTYLIRKLSDETVYGLVLAYRD